MLQARDTWYEKPTCQQMEPDIQLQLVFASNVLKGSEVPPQSTLQLKCSGMVAL